MFCPVCRLKYKQGFTTCSDCGVELVYELPPEQGEEFIEYEEILSILNPAGIAIIKSIFEDEQITYHFLDEQYNYQGSPLTVPARLMVKKEQVETAKELLKNVELSIAANSEQDQNPYLTKSSRKLPIEFTGSAGEYFRIWIVNLCLTLLTAGIFSAWAKVRKKRYYYSHTMLDGTPFQYLGRPLPILKGRVIAAIAFSAYYVSSHFFTAMLPYVLMAGAVLAPWVIIRSAAFNTRYSSFRNMTFRFDGKYMSALKAIYTLGIIPALLVAIGMAFERQGGYAAIAMAAAIIIFGLSFPWWIKQFKSFIIGHTYYGNREGELSATGGQFFKMYLIAGLILLVTFVMAGISIAILAAKIFSFENPQLFVLLAAVPMYGGYVLSYAYIKARGTNLVWNHTRLGQVHFESTLSAGGMAKLYLTNALAIIASLGLLTPWAVMRTLKYRADNLQVLLEGDLTDFRGSETDTVQAVGAEFGDFFDMDLSL